MVWLARWGRLGYALPMNDALSYDAVIVGAGPAGLACAIRLAQRGALVAVLEKGGTVGAHSVSGAVVDMQPLTDLLPHAHFPHGTPVKRERFAALTPSKTLFLPTPPPLRNARGAQILSLCALTRWLAEQAESLGVDVLPGFAGRALLTQENTVIGVKTGEADIMATHTILAEGARGSLTKDTIKRFGLDAHKSPQTYALGLKEVWEIDSQHHREGEVMHTIGWPLGLKTYGGGFVYHAGEGRIFLGLIVGLDYQNPYLDPFGEMQRMKTHPFLATLLKGGRRLEYGARVLAEGGLQALPRLTFPGGCLIGDCAGFLNVACLKGINNAVRSGILAADAIVDGRDYQAAFDQSALRRELWRVRNIRPGFTWGLIPGLMNAGFEWATRGYAPWTWPHRLDAATLKPADACPRIDYPAPDGVLTFDRASSVYLSSTFHAERGPAHLILTDPAIPIRDNLPRYAEPAQRYCPAGVYAVEGGRFHIRAANCVHCKACDIKDPAQNITWTLPEGGEGPNYKEM